MLIMGDDEKGFDSADLILSKGFGEDGEDEESIDANSANAMFKDMLTDSAKRIKTAFTSGDDSRIVNALSQFLDTYLQSREVSKKG